MVYTLYWWSVVATCCLCYVNVNVSNRFIVIFIHHTYIAQSHEASLLRCVCEWVTTNRNRFVFSDCLKLLLLSAGSRRLSGSEFQAVGPLMYFSKLFKPDKKKFSFKLNSKGIRAGGYRPGWAFGQGGIMPVLPLGNGRSVSQFGSRSE